VTFLSRIRARWAELVEQTLRSRCLQVLALIPEEAFALPGQPLSRREVAEALENSEEGFPLGSLLYAAWLYEASEKHLPDDVWFRLAVLATDLQMRADLESYWPTRLEHPWPFSPPSGARPFDYDPAPYQALVSSGADMKRVAIALIEAGAGPVNGVRMLRKLFQVDYPIALSAYRDAERSVAK